MRMVSHSLLMARRGVLVVGVVGLEAALSLP
jgi:hypothetical protein